MLKIRAALIYVAIKICLAQYFILWKWEIIKPTEEFFFLLAQGIGFSLLLGILLVLFSSFFEMLNTGGKWFFDHRNPFWKIIEWSYEHEQNNQPKRPMRITVAIWHAFYLFWQLFVAFFLGFLAGRMALFAAILYFC